MKQMYDPKRTVCKLVDNITSDLVDAIDAAYRQGQEWMRDECARAVRDAWDDAEGEMDRDDVCAAINDVEIDEP